MMRFLKYMISTGSITAMVTACAGNKPKQPEMVQQISRRYCTDVVSPKAIQFQAEKSSVVSCLLEHKDSLIFLEVKTSHLETTLHPDSYEMHETYLKDWFEDWFSRTYFRSGGGNTFEDFKTFAPNDIWFDYTKDRGVILNVRFPPNALHMPGDTEKPLPFATHMQMYFGNGRIYTWLKASN